MLVKKINSALLFYIYFALILYGFATQTVYLDKYESATEIDSLLAILLFFFERHGLSASGIRFIIGFLVASYAATFVATLANSEIRKFGFFVLFAPIALISVYFQFQYYQYARELYFGKFTLVPISYLVCLVFTFFTAHAAYKHSKELDLSKKESKDEPSIGAWTLYILALPFYFYVPQIFNAFTALLESYQFSFNPIHILGFAINIVPLIGYLIPMYFGLDTMAGKLALHISPRYRNVIALGILFFGYIIATQIEKLVRYISNFLLKCC